jgi:hypothetical protein
MKNLALALLASAAFAQSPDASWPQPTRENKPWTRWWWLGSAVDAENITRQLTEFRDAGLGGVEICPIYGAKGAEAQFLKFLSPEWVAMLRHTTREAARLGMAVDLTTGTGWPFGGPGVSVGNASMRVGINDPKAKGPVIQKIDGYEFKTNGPLMKVKRAAPGGEGWVLDPYSTNAMDAYLAIFDAALGNLDAPKPRAHFHDSFEYFGANWTPDFPAQFEKHRGYPLPWAALAGVGDAMTVARVKCDYRETLADLHLAYMDRWEAWARKNGSVARNQGHGAPCNLLDLYGAADIPETEIFRHVDERQIPMLKMASSAAHVNGRTLCSSETFTWLGEHFQVTLAEMKKAADFVFLGGVNHIFYHGIPYSPTRAQWPGWLFYASTHLGPNGGLWHDMPAFTTYLTHVQSILQSGAPSSDVLLYYPQHDLWMNAEGLGQTYTVHDQEKWLWPSDYYAIATSLWSRGFTFDGLSDRKLTDVKTDNGGLEVGGNRYRAILIPRVKFMPEATLARLAALADSGAKIIFHDALPGEVPGFHEWEKRTAALRATGAAMQRKVLAGTEVEPLLAAVGIARETMVDRGLRFVRRSHEKGFHYFIVNPGDTAFDGTIELSTPAQSIAILDPLHGATGSVAAKPRLQIPAGGSVILRTFTTEKIDAPAWKYADAADNATTVNGPWSVTFIHGGPTIPSPFSMSELASWTTQSEAASFAGTAVYRTKFELPAEGRWQIDLGKVAESARVRINGKNIGTSFIAPHVLEIGDAVVSGVNQLEIEITNVAANRIADLDRRKVEWKAFHEINFVNIDYKPFDASAWPLRESGLLGAVRLIPLK